MSRTAQELMTREVATCRHDGSAADAASSMARSDCGCVFVVDQEERLLGTVTDRDICLTAQHRGVSLDAVPIASAMSPFVFACRPDDGLDAVMRLMRRCRVRRVPVVGTTGKLLGVVSLGDLAREAAHDACDSDYGITNDDIGLTLATICWGPVSARDAEVQASEAVSSWEAEGNPNEPTRPWASNQHQRPRSVTR